MLRLFLPSYTVTNQQFASDRSLAALSLVSSIFFPNVITLKHNKTLNIALFLRTDVVNKLELLEIMIVLQTDNFASKSLSYLVDKET